MSSKFVQEVLNIGRGMLELCQQCKALEKALLTIDSYKKGSIYPEVSFTFKFGTFDSQTFKTAVLQDPAVLTAAQEFLMEISRLNRNEIRRLVDVLTSIPKIDE